MRKSLGQSQVSTLHLSTPAACQGGTGRWGPDCRADRTSAGNARGLVKGQPCQQGWAAPTDGQVALQRHVPGSCIAAGLQQLAVQVVLQPPQEPHGGVPLVGGAGQTVQHLQGGQGGVVPGWWGGEESRGDSCRCPAAWSLARPPRPAPARPPRPARPPTPPPTPHPRRSPLALGC